MMINWDHTVGEADVYRQHTGSVGLLPVDLWDYSHRETSWKLTKVQLLLSQLFASTLVGCSSLNICPFNLCVYDTLF